MKIIIDINHPADVHFFKNIISGLQKSAHKFLIISRNKEVEHNLLRDLQLPFIDRGTGRNSIVGKVIYYFQTIVREFRIVKQFKPDLAISFGTPYIALVSFLNSIPHFSIYDTEHARFHLLMTNSFSEYILTPACFTKDLGKKQVLFDSYTELTYLHPEYYTCNRSKKDLVGVPDEEKFILIRFVSWNAIHDKGFSGLNVEQKRMLVHTLAKDFTIFISSESELPNDLEEYALNINPSHIHDVLYHASLFIGEGATMASESACLGTPAIYINELPLGYCTELEEKYSILFNYHKLPAPETIVKKAIEVMKYDTDYWGKALKKILTEKINPTVFIIDWIENYFNKRSK
jgi:uncharacterized protein